MSNQTPNRAGSVNGAGDVDALFLKQFSGEVLTAFMQTNVTMGRHQVRTISNGKSSQFPVAGRATAFYHTPGNEILGGAVNHGEKVIVIDDVLISPTFLADIDDAKNHHDVRDIYSSESGMVLANQMDKHVLQVGVLAARTATGNVTDLPGGTVITEAIAADFADPIKLAAALFAAAQTMDEKSIPETDRVAFLSPAKYYTLVQSEKAINRDFGGAGSFSDGSVFRVAGIEIVKTINLPTTNVLTATLAAGTGDRYLGDFTKTLGLVMHKSAVGTVKLMDLSTRVDYDPRRLGHQIVAKYAVGHGVLRPEAAIELKGL